jgi:hypothetical protein
MDAIITAAKAAHAHEFIQAMPNGYDSKSVKWACSCPAASAKGWRLRGRC